MTDEQIEHLFRTYAEARRKEVWAMLWTLVGACMSREQAIEHALDRAAELEARSCQQGRALDILQAGHSKLYQQAHSTPRAVDSTHVRQALLAIDHELKAGMQ